MALLAVTIATDRGTEPTKNKSLHTHELQIRGVFNMMVFISSLWFSVQDNTNVFKFFSLFKQRVIYLTQRLLEPIRFQMVKGHVFHTKKTVPL